MPKEVKECEAAEKIVPLSDVATTLVGFAQH